MKPVDFKGANTTLNAPSGNEHNVEPMRVFRNGIVCTSCWELTLEEIEALKIEALHTGSGKLYLSVFSGGTQPPVFLADEDSTRSVLADLGGVWKR
jgi:hypothetical protein